MKKRKYENKGSMKTKKVLKQRKYGKKESIKTKKDTKRIILFYFVLIHVCIINLFEIYL